MDAHTNSHVSQPVVGNAGLKNIFKSTRKQLLLVAVIVGLIGSAVLIATFALTSSNGDFEAETMTVEAL